MFLNFLLTAAQTQLNADGFCSPPSFASFSQHFAPHFHQPAASKHGRMLSLLHVGLFGSLVVLVFVFAELKFLLKLTLINAQAAGHLRLTCP